jgi:amino acid permease
MGSFFGMALGEVWYSSQWFYVVLLGFLMVPVILKKELAELEVLSYMLFVSLGLFILVNFIQLFFDANF